jgi:flavin-dependent dehydrogenase
MDEGDIRVGVDRDVTIVGASTSGLFAATVLARRGLRVTVHERAEQLDPIPRTLIVTERMRCYLGGLGETAVVNEISRFELFANGKVATVELSQPDLIIERSAMIRELAKEAEAAGVELELGSRFVELEPDHAGVVARFKDRAGKTTRISSSSIIGADGGSSRVAKSAGWPAQPSVPLVQAVVAMPSDCAVDSSRVWFVPDDTPYFYWLVPESESRGALGVIGEDPAESRRRLDAFLERKGLEVFEYQAALIPRYAGWINVKRRLGRGNIYLVGDAAGHVKVSTVGGIVTGFRGALGVVDSITDGSDRELRLLRRELNLHLIIRKAMHRFTQDDYVRILSLLNKPTTKHLGNHSRDETEKILWRIAFAQPKLLLMGLKGILTS